MKFLTRIYMIVRRFVPPGRVRLVPARTVLKPPRGALTGRARKLLLAGRLTFDQGVDLRFRLGPVIAGIPAGETAFFSHEIGFL